MGPGIGACGRLRPGGRGRAQGARSRRWVPGGPGPVLELPTRRACPLFFTRRHLPRHHLRPQTRRRRQHAVVRHQVLARRWHQRAQALHQDRVRHHHRRRAVGEAPLQRVPDPAVRQFGQPRLAHRRTRGVAAQRLQAIAVARRHPGVGVQREAVQLRAQRALGVRPPATIAADTTVAPARARTEGRASCHRRGGEAGQQVVSGCTVSVRRGVFVDPLPGFAQRPQHASADALHEQLHVGVRNFRLRVEHRLPLPRHPAVRAVQPEHMEVHIELYVAPRSAAAQEAIAGFQLAETLVCDLVASEPDLANPVAFAIDGKGRVYVAETFRIKDGVFDDRDYMQWKDEDLACRTVAERLAKYEKHIKDRIPRFAAYSERVRLLVDTDRRMRSSWDPWACRWFD
jgi:hypothetical protein